MLSFSCCSPVPCIVNVIKCHAKRMILDWNLFLLLNLKEVLESTQLHKLNCVRKKTLLSQKVRIILAKASPRRRINFFYTQCSASLPSFSCFKTLCIRCICVRKLSSNFFVHLLNKKKEVVWVLFHFFQRGHRWMFTAHSMHILFIFLPTLSAFGRYIQVPCSSIPKGGFYRV